MRGNGKRQLQRTLIAAVIAMSLGLSAIVVLQGFSTSGPIRLLQTLAHELRHAQQTAGLTDVSEKAPWLSYEILRNLGRSYIAVALVGALAIQWLLVRELLLPAVIVGSVLIVLALVYIVLAYLNYHLDPMEVDARAYERSNWQEWEECLQLKSPPTHKKI